MSGDGLVPWQRRDIAAACFVVAFLVAMVAIPVWQLQVPFGTREIGRFGWQMYARDHVQPTFEAYWPDCRSAVVTSRYRFRTWWGDFGYREMLVRDLCNENGGAVRVVGTKDYLPGYREEFPCP